MYDLIFQLSLLQVALPLLLIALNALIPAQSATGFILRMGAIFLVLIYTTLAGIWLFPPWWAPYFLALVHLIAGVWAFRRFRMARRIAQRRRKIFEIVAASAAIGGGVMALYPAIQGRQADAVAINLDMPLGPGRYLVISGGAHASINSHFLTLDLERAKAFRGQSFAIDIIGIDQWGFRTTGISPKDPKAYEIYGAQVLAPCAGRVSHVVDGVADNEVPNMNRKNMTGNHVMLECGDVCVLLAHMAPGSVAVARDDLVESGEPLGRVGNSGNSGEPHLHIHVQTKAPDNAPVAGNPLWFTVEGRFLVRNDRILVE